ncbi:hypothetical protein [Nocardia sp. alder85J]|uniref:hypothetical protein n=1 Tax=Nocardia sp. alder85J TaxID=2862949 RepID=UPI001CD5800A|nr:hypothetical protein [Nocardia sp. alder85J]MCX4091090.1 hypothetical protein [Nocardia sp. alder85J]
MFAQRWIVTAAVAAAALTVVTAGAAQVSASPGADPATGVSAPAVAEVHYQARIIDGSVVATLTDGATFVAQPATRTIAILNRAGQVLESVPTSFVIGDRNFPVAGEISADGGTLRLTPQVDGVAAAAAAAPIASPLENQLATNDAINLLSAGLGIGSLVGTILGTVVGAGMGLAVAGATCLVISIGCLLTVFPEVALGATIGGIVGINVAGAASGLGAVWTYVQTMLAAPGQSIYASQIPAYNNPPVQTPAGEGGQ